MLNPLNFGIVILGGIILILDIMAILRILKSGMGDLQKLLRILIILFGPVIGLVLYYLLANNK